MGDVLSVAAALRQMLRHLCTVPVGHRKVGDNIYRHSEDEFDENLFCQHIIVSCTLLFIFHFQNGEKRLACSCIPPSLTLIPDAYFFCPRIHTHPSVDLWFLQWRTAVPWNSASCSTRVQACKTVSLTLDPCFLG